LAIAPPLSIKELESDPPEPGQGNNWVPSLVLAASLSFVCGLVLEQVVRGRTELKRLAYLAIPAISPGK
jgi:hypothetical protein